MNTAEQANDYAFRAGVITKTGGKNVFFESCDQLNVASPQKAFNLQSRGGKGEPYNSGIKIVLTSWADGGDEENLAAGNDGGEDAAVGKNATIVSANVPSDIYNIICDVCLKNISKPTVDLGRFGNALMRTYGGVTIIGSALAMLSINMTKAFGQIVNDLKKGQQLNVTEMLTLLGGAIKAGRDVLGGDPASIQADGTDVNIQYDYRFTQSKVNAHKKRDDGKVAVSTLNITRKGIVNGSVPNYPWTVSMQIFYANAITDSKGMTNYDPKTRDASSLMEAKCILTDQDMFFHANRVVTYVNAWINGVALPNMKKAVAAREELRAEWRNKQ